MEGWPVHVRWRWLTGRVRGVALVVLGCLLAPSAAYASTEPGVDTSHYQHAPSLDWSAVRASGIRFAFLKATEGSTYNDPWFAADWTATAKVGIYRGAYHFARPSVGSAASQASHFVKTIGVQTGRGTLPPVLDLEATGGLSSSQLITWTRNWLEAVEQLTGRTPIIYVSPAFWKYNLANSTAFHAYPLWIANYGVSQPTVPGGWPTWTFWQGSSTGRVKGISGDVDTDTFNGSLTQLQKLALDDVPVATTLRLTPSSTAPTAGQSVTFAGTLLDASGHPVTGRTVHLASSPPGSTTWTRVASATTSSTGAYAVSLPVSAAARYRARFAGDTSYATSTSAVATVDPRVPTTLSLASSSNDVLAGSTVTLSGALSGTGPLGGAPVTLQSQLPGSTTWTPVQSATTAADGTFSVPLAAKTSAAYRVVYAGSAAYAPATSPTQAVTVSRAPTSASLSLSNSAPYLGTRVTLSGVLSDGTLPVAGRTVTVLGRAAGGTTWTTVGTATTDGAGHYAVATTVTGAETYRTDFAGDELFLPASSPTRDTTITPPAATVLTLRSPVSHLRRGATTTLSGKLLTTDGAALAGRRVVLWKRLVGTSSWYRVTHMVTAANGGWSIGVVPPRSAYFRVAWAGGLRYAAARSAAVRIDVS